MEIFLVHVETGAYEDHVESVDAVFDSLEKANAYVDSRRKLLDELGLHANGNDSRIYDFQYRQEQSKLHNFPCYYSGTWYNISGPYEVK